MTTREEGAVPDFLRMDESIGSDAANSGLTGDWYGWPSKDVRPSPCWTMRAARSASAHR